MLGKYQAGRVYKYCFQRPCSFFTDLSRSWSSKRLEKNWHEIVSCAAGPNFIRISSDAEALFLPSSNIVILGFMCTARAYIDPFSLLRHSYRCLQLRYMLPKPRGDCTMSSILRFQKRTHPGHMSAEVLLPSKSEINGHAQSLDQRPTKKHTLIHYISCCATTSFIDSHWSTGHDRLWQESGIVCKKALRNLFDLSLLHRF